MNIPFIKYSKFWLVLSAVTAVAAIFCLAKWGLKPGIDFTGGSLIKVTFSANRPEVVQMKEVFDGVGLKDAVVQKAGDNSMIIRTSFVSEEIHQSVLKAVRTKFENKDVQVREDSFETVGPSVSDSLKKRTKWAVILVCLGIISYVAYAFRQVSRPVASWKYGLLAIIALLHDVMLVIGIFAILGHYFGTEIDVGFVVAL